MNPLDNLNPFPPGVSGNPEGRKHGSKNRATVLREILAMCIEGEDLSGVKAKYPVETLVINALAKKAMDGDVPAIKEIQDTMHGKLVDKTAATDPEGNELMTDAELRAKLADVSAKLAKYEP